ncbi:MAG: hypothetical protein IJ695_06420 [Butyrivibrio sp.]|nr:hypothetical protein [Butyrivibrio sp.]
MEYGEIVDVPFPSIEALASEEEISKLAEEYVDRIRNLVDADGAVMAQGEFTLTYAVIRMLKAGGIKVVSACSERDSIESIDETGNTVRKSVFFLQTV